MTAKSAFLIVTAVILLIASIALLSFAIFSDNWQHIDVNHNVLERLSGDFVFVTRSSSTTTTTTRKPDITLPPWYQPNCSCPTCPPNSTVYVNITWPTTTTPSTSTTTESPFYDEYPDESEYYHAFNDYVHYYHYYEDDVPMYRAATAPPRKEWNMRRRWTYIGNKTVVTASLKQRDITFPPEEENQTPVKEIKDYTFFSRIVGLFRLCFKMERPDNIDKDCMTISSASESTPNATADYVRQSTKKINILRCVIAFLALTVLIAVVVFILVYVSGCLGWSPVLLGILSLLCVFGVILGAVGMVLFHYAEMIEKRSWVSHVRLNSTINYDYAYIFAWVGIALLLFAAIFLNLFAARMRRRKADNEEEASVFYYYFYPPR